jgi:hypothetical protein
MILISFIWKVIVNTNAHDLFFQLQVKNSRLDCRLSQKYLPNLNCFFLYIDVYSYATFWATRYHECVLYPFVLNYHVWNFSSRQRRQSGCCVRCSYFAFVFLRVLFVWVFELLPLVFTCAI